MRPQRCKLWDEREWTAIVIAPVRPSVRLCVHLSVRPSVLEKLAVAAASLLAVWCLSLYGYKVIRTKASRPRRCEARGKHQRETRTLG